jgi:hypothetical protein
MVKISSSCKNLNISPVIQMRINIDIWNWNCLIFLERKADQANKANEIKRRNIVVFSNKGKNESLKSVLPLALI